MKPSVSAMDALNRGTMSGATDEYSAIVHEGLNAQERAALAHAVADRRGLRVLDLGVGAGRTVAPLMGITSNYVGVDYVEEMVDHCRKRFPGVRFERMDARSLTAFRDGEFDIVFFSCNGISMVNHEGRLAILSEVRRVLAPDGWFVFSTPNRDSWQYAARFRLPDLIPTANPVKLAVRVMKHLGLIAYRAFNRLRYIRHEERREDYAIINSVYHHYQTMLYFISIDAQRRQLEAAGFDKDIVVHDLAGHVVSGHCSDGTIAFTAKRAA
jgi:SAM-dependent methyltransferase